MQFVGLFGLLVQLGGAESGWRGTHRRGGEDNTPGLELPGALSVIEANAGIIGDRDCRVWLRRSRAVRIQGRQGAAVTLVVCQEVVTVDSALHAVVPDCQDVVRIKRRIVDPEHEGDRLSLVVGGVVAVQVSELPLRAQIGPLGEPDLEGGTVGGSGVPATGIALVVQCRSPDHKQDEAEKQGGCHRSKRE